MGRQTIFGLFGDIQGKILDPQKVFLTELIKHATLNLEYDQSAMAQAGFSNNNLIQEYGSDQHNALSVCTNACWALGEAVFTSTNETQIGLNMKEAVNPYAA